MAVGFGVLFGVSVVLAVFIVLLVYTKRKTEQINASGGCPVCHGDVPAFRRPTSFRQALWGGWTCETCGTDLDRNGMKLAEPGR